MEDSVAIDLSKNKTRAVANDNDIAPWKQIAYSVGMSGLASILSIILVTLAFNGRLKVLYPREKLVLNNFSEKLEFTARYWVLSHLWIYTTLHIVWMKRMLTNAINPLSGNEDRVRKYVNINTNSIEQMLYSIVGQVTIITCIDGEKTINIIPMLNALYIIGRILFQAGYPNSRGFGMALTFFPVSLAMFYSTFALIKFVDPGILKFE